MPIGEVCTREVVIAKRETTILEAAQLMRHYHVGNLVVTENREGRGVPVGVVTDRDIAVSVVAPQVNASVFTCGDLLTRELVTAHEDEGILESIHKMRINGIRRMPVVDSEGGLVGIIAVDDLIHLLSREMNELAKLISWEQAQEAQTKL